jgi:glycosyltransferase involved in cell wall biosynthesis
MESVGEVVGACKRYCCEVIVVDDCSSDDTKVVSEQAGGTVIRNNTRLGLVKSMVRGFELATGNILVTLDADGQHNPSEIQALVQPIIHGEADLVLGRRGCKLPFSERVISKVVNLHVKCFDVGSGFRAVSLGVARKMRLWGACPCGSFVLEAYECGARITEVPIRIQPRKCGRSHWSVTSRGLTHTKQLLMLIQHMLL